jgi:hypothetical protein
MAGQQQMIERKPIRPSERNFLHDEENSPTTESAPASAATNGSGATITRDSPLMDRLSFHERRLSAALTGATTATKLAELLADTDLAIVEAEDFAKCEQEAALDPTISPDPQAARARAEDAAFMVGRLKTLRPRLFARYQQAVAAEAVDAYRRKLAELTPERDRLERELAETYQDAVGKLLGAFGRIRNFQQRVQTTLGDPPPNCAVLTPIDTRVLDKIVLADFAHPERNIWPPPSTFASDFAANMGIPPHPGSHWSDPDIQQRRREELAADQERHAAAYSKAGQDETERINRQERERFKGAN